MSLTATARQVYSLNDNWQFFFKAETSGDYARHISLPHTWNLDALAGTGEYKQTTANYTRDIYVPAEWSNKRLFLKFHGVQNVADVFINGNHAGEHRGGWTAFTFEITPFVEFDKNNSVVVVVSNAYQNDIFSTPVFWRRVQGFFGADHKAFSQKHLSLDGAVEGYKARLALAQQGTHIKQ